MTPPLSLSQDDRGGVLGSSEPILIGGDRRTVLLDGPAVDLAEQERGPGIVLTESDPVVLGLGSGEWTAVGHNFPARCTATQSLEDIGKMIDGVDGLLKIPVVDDNDGWRGELVGLEAGYFLGLGHTGLPFGWL